MITTTIRVNPVLYDKIVNQSKIDMRSINTEICFILKQYLDMINWNHKK